eukprot:gene3955-5399_t
MGVGGLFEQGNNFSIHSLSVSGRINTITSNGVVYSTLSDVSITSTVSTCQNYWLTLPAGWAIAPDTPEVRNILVQYPWSTDVLVLASGVGYRTTKFPPAGIAYGDYQSKFTQSGDQYYCPWCNYQIMIMLTASICGTGAEHITLLQHPPAPSVPQVHIPQQEPPTVAAARAATARLQVPEHAVQLVHTPLPVAHYAPAA